MIKNYFVLLFLIGNCTNDKPEVVDKENVPVKVGVDYAVQSMSELNEENKTIIDTFKQMVENTTYGSYSEYWSKEDTLIYSKPYHDLDYIINYNTNWWQPTILSIQKIKEKKYKMKIAMMGNHKTHNSLNYIYNILVLEDKLGHYSFKNIINDNISNWQYFSKDNITYYLPNDRIINIIKIKQQLLFEQNLRNLLNLTTINYKFIVCKNNHQIFKLRGYDYEDSMFFNDQTGGVAYSSQRIIFSGNDSEYYPHETVHMYVYRNFPNINKIISEGLATYLGGSKGLDYKVHVLLLKDFIEKKDVKLSEYLFNSEKRLTRIAESSSIMYASGALLCHLAHENGDKDKLINLMSTGKTDEELINGIENVFGVKFENFDAFIEESLNNFK